MKKKARKKLERVDRMLQKQGVLPGVGAYLNLYASLQALYYQKKYELVISTCDGLLKSLEF